MKTNKVVIFGATGMIGKAVLLECLEDERIKEVTCIMRKYLDVKHPKLRVLICKDFKKLEELSNKIQEYNACYYAIGIPSSGLSEDDYSRITYDYTISAAKMLVVRNPNLIFCYVSAQGADSTEKSNSMWARVRGKTENTLMTYPFKKFYSFRIGYVLPMKGVKSRVKNYRLIYALTSPFYGLIKHFPSFASTSVEVAQAMINVTYYNYDSSILGSRDIVDISKLKK